MLNSNTFSSVKQLNVLLSSVSPKCSLIVFVCNVRFFFLHIYFFTNSFSTQQRKPHMYHRICYFICYMNFFCLSMNNIIFKNVLRCIYQCFKIKTYIYTLKCTLINKSIHQYIYSRIE